MLSFLKKKPVLSKGEEDFLKSIDARLKALERNGESQDDQVTQMQDNLASYNQDKSNAASEVVTVRKLDSMFGSGAPTEANSLSLLLNNNKVWAGNKIRDDPNFFNRLHDNQMPNYMWIGCSDSRVPANQIVSMPPGEIFVHRNVANLVYATDNNVMSVLQYAIEYLKVKHVIVCGHECCGGVKAAFGPSLPYPLEAWLSSIRTLKGQHSAQLAAIESEDERWAYLCEANVRAQVATLATLPVVQNAWANKQPLSIHGLMYSMDNGVLRDMDCTQPKFLADYLHGAMVGEPKVREIVMRNQ